MTSTTYTVVCISVIVLWVLPDGCYLLARYVADSEDILHLLHDGRWSSATERSVSRVSN